MDDRKLNITLLCGGISAEREVSLLSGKAIAKGLTDAGHHVWQSDISPTELSALDCPCDLVFPALHGAFGEDGQLQRILENRNIPFVGSGEIASRLGMDKAATKARLLENNVPTANWQIVYKRQFSQEWTPIAGIGFPCVIKPIADGSSVGCKICRSAAEARAHLEETLPQYTAMLVEQYIDGPELTVGILDGKALPVIWIKPTTAFYDFEAKYTRDDTDYIFDDQIPLSSAILEKVRKAAADTHRVVGCRHLSRIDVMVDRHTNQPYVLEINTMPGFTSHSLVPKAAEEAGIRFPELCDRLARMALRDAVVNSH